MTRSQRYVESGIAKHNAISALATPGSKPPRASRPTASTTPSPTPATHSDRPPTDKRERTHWQRAQHDLQRAQRDLGHRNDRRHSHEV
jgi:hypothetical protein